MIQAFMPVISDPPTEECADKVQVAPGEYTIRSAAETNTLPYCSSSETIKVNARAYTETTVFCDTGIR